ncbi:cell division control protein 4 [Fomitiporia mediterranea MF3/22]|uniref:cell division control protein 4 n=1 Tax=Fomitiporia mediterranea (strain MF3/22) TaxID=694068 RepID=UPI0004408C40|nr:cell division control protein 4 [Fomitiporia mediterranea MF3/22]EJD02157.1 cell division control protein 4 [Fomitiporia mediterranea MF3/22]
MSVTGPSPPIEPDNSELTSWVKNDNPKHLSFPVHGRHVVTCLLITSRGRVVSAGDDAEIYVYSLSTGKQIHSLKGHEGGVWTVKAYKETLVSGSTDKTVRVWDLKTGNCMHVFGGHTNTVRCLEVVRPEEVDWTDEDGVRRRECWPKEPLIVSGSRDYTLRVWTLPKRGEAEYRCSKTKDLSDEDTTKNPYYRFVLEGHEHAVRALDARGRIAVSGSYDNTVCIWDIITGKCKWVLAGHTQKVYSAVLDLERDQVYSGSLDSTVRIWSVTTGECIHTLLGHTSLVGLLGISSSYLASASADATVRIWNPETGELQHVLQSSHNGPITCFQHDDFKVLSGSDGSLRMWDVKTGSFVKDLLNVIHGVWQVAFKGRWCVAASNRADHTMLDIWDFSRTALEGEESGDVEDSFSVSSDEEDETED